MAEKTTQSSHSIEPIYTLRTQNGNVNDVQFHPTQGNLLLSGHSSGDLNLWNLSRRRIEKSYQAHEQNTGGALSSLFIDSHTIVRYSFVMVPCA
ncbi:hypothetical protein PROFUN_10220 [Planoprotostelium fungivorum]|uniref:Uncharacterized protein n=1 Tax=Planoprotostelium fungivorum TaxID=1890364 RepID=A0A2P6MQ82_9EUKA|nr:hypothetical protein PROFUN_10220 [Planoprotostelium fungivorum]